MIVRRCLNTAAELRYVEKVRLLDYWQLQDEPLIREFPRSQLYLMMDKKPLVTIKGDQVNLVMHSYKDLKRRLDDYGLSFDIRCSSLLDAVRDGKNDWVPLFGTSVVTEPIPDDSPFQKSDIIKQLAGTLEGKFLDLRFAMLTLSDPEQRNLLAKFQALTRWSKTYIRCPRCAAVLRMRASKSGATCTTCSKVFYPTFSPCTITLVRNPSNTHCLLVRHKGSLNGIYTCIAGFATSGESLLECARREIAEEAGVEVTDLKSLNASQPWPMPDSSLMVAHEAVADMSQKVTVCPDELEAAHWFSREEVAVALNRVNADPFLKNIPRSVNERQNLHYIPPRGAIAHQMISDWVHQKL